MKMKQTSANADRKMPSEDTLMGCHYTATLINGTFVDWSPPDKTLYLKPKDQIEGLKEAMMSVPEGSKYMFYIPARVRSHLCKNRAD